MKWLSALLILVLIVIFWQDYKDRFVYWFLYPFVGILGLCIQLKLGYSSLFIFYSFIINLLFIATIISLLWIYTKYILKKKFYNTTIGSGDLLFFICLCTVFSVEVFIVLFVFSIITSLLLHLFLKNRYHNNVSVPLAGYMALFFGVVLITPLLTQYSFYSITQLFYGC